MFTREEASHLRQEFWTSFGQYMNPVLSTDGMKINWINYRTTMKDIHFRMDNNSKTATVSIALEHNDPEIRELHFQQFEEFKTLLHATLQEEWGWQLHAPLKESKVTSQIYKEHTCVSVLNKDQRPELISLFKPPMIALDSFWGNAKYSFEALR